MKKIFCVFFRLFIYPLELFPIPIELRQAVKTERHELTGTSIYDRESLSHVIFTIFILFVMGSLSIFQSVFIHGSNSAYSNCFSVL